MWTYPSKKSQSAIEFVMLIGAVLVVFITVLGIFQKNINDKEIEKRGFEFQQLAQNVQTEINLAARATSGYQRTFTIPQKVEGMDYGIQLIADSVYINSSNGKYALSISAFNVTGIIRKGSNTIKKINDTIYLN